MSATGLDTERTRRIHPTTLRVVHGADLIDAGLRARLLRLTLEPVGDLESDMRQFLRHPPVSVSWAILAEEGDQILGWAALYGDHCQLGLDVFVDPPHRGKGIGRTLVHEALAMSRGADVMVNDLPFYRCVLPKFEPFRRVGVDFLWVKR